MSRDVHVSVDASAITSFLETDRSQLMCFRCGEYGHMRNQCLTYKVRLCYRHQMGNCPDAACTFAHGEAELRTPWRLRCVRVVRQGNDFVCIGCNSTNHTFRRCPLHQDLLFL